MMRLKTATYVLASLLLFAGGNSAQAAPMVDATGLVAGNTNEITLTGGTPNAIVKVMLSIDGPGAGPCLPSAMLEHLCFDILFPKRSMAMVTLDASGNGVVSTMIPGGAAGSTIWLQPFEFRGPSSTLGAVTEWYIDAWVDGCTDTTATNYDPSATVDDGTCLFATCPGGGAAIYTQADVDLYINCTELDYVYVHAISDLYDFELPLLQTVHDYFYFYQSPNIVTISTPSLQEVGGYVYIDGNTSLESVNFESLTYVGNYLYVTGNDVLAEMSLLSLTTIEEYAYFDNDILCLDASLDWDAITDFDHYIGDPTC